MPVNFSDLLPDFQCRVSMFHLSPSVSTLVSYLVFVRTEARKG